MKLIKWFLYTILALAVLLLLFIGPVDQTPLRDQPFYQNMIKELDTLKLTKHPARTGLRASWAKFNITPHYSLPMAGYKPRGHFDTVHDSIFTRVAALSNGDITVFIITADLMLFPPVLKSEIDSRLRTQYKGKYFLYFNATHSHSSIGGWDQSAFGEFVLGKYHPEWVEEATDGTIKAILQAQQQLLPAHLYYWEADAKEYVQNRLDAQGESDGILRGFRIVRSDSTQALLSSFSAHATNINHKGLAISGDYPNALNSEVESNGYNFSMFMAGMVGSHRATGFSEIDFELTSMYANVLTEKALHAVATETKLPDTLPIITKHIPIIHGPAQLHIARNWRVRTWLFNWFSRPLQGEFTYLQLGNVIMLGTSCDFSGEIYTHEQLGQLAAAKQKKLFITSFNGDYTGYITLDKYYDHINEEEVMTLNWVGPYYGQYYTDMIKKLLTKSPT